MGSRPVLDWRRAGSATDGRQLTKLLVNVTVERSLGPLHVLLPGEKTVADLIGAAVHMYVKEGRRPLLANADPKEFELHYNQYSFESYDKGKGPTLSLVAIFFGTTWRVNHMKITYVLVHLYSFMLVSVCVCGSYLMRTGLIKCFVQTPL